MSRSARPTMSSASSLTSANTTSHWVNPVYYQQTADSTTTQSTSVVSAADSASTALPTTTPSEDKPTDRSPANEEQMEHRSEGKEVDETIVTDQGEDGTKFKTTPNDQQSTNRSQQHATSLSDRSELPPAPTPASGVGALVTSFDIGNTSTIGADTVKHVPFLQTARNERVLPVATDMTKELLLHIWGPTREFLLDAISMQTSRHLRQFLDLMEQVKNDNGKWENVSFALFSHELEKVLKELLSHRKEMGDQQQGLCEAVKEIIKEELGEFLAASKATGSSPGGEEVSTSLVTPTEANPAPISLAQKADTPRDEPAIGSAVCAEEAVQRALGSAIEPLVTKLNAMETTIREFAEVIDLCKYKAGTLTEADVLKLGKHSTPMEHAISRGIQQHGYNWLLPLRGARDEIRDLSDRIGKDEDRMTLLERIKAEEKAQIKLITRGLEGLKDELNDMFKDATGAILGVIAVVNKLKDNMVEATEFRNLSKSFSILDATMSTLATKNETEGALKKVGDECAQVIDDKIKSLETRLVSDHDDKIDSFSALALENQRDTLREVRDLADTRRLELAQAQTGVNQFSATAKWCEDAQNRIDAQYSRLRDNKFEDANTSLNASLMALDHQHGDFIIRLDAIEKQLSLISAMNITVDGNCMKEMIKEATKELAAETAREAEQLPPPPPPPPTANITLNEDSMRQLIKQVANEAVSEYRKTADQLPSSSPCTDQNPTISQETLKQAIKEAADEAARQAVKEITSKMDGSDLPGGNPAQPSDSLPVTSTPVTTSASPAQVVAPSPAAPVPATSAGSSDRLSKAARISDVTILFAIYLNGQLVPNSTCSSPAKDCTTLIKLKQVFSNGITTELRSQGLTKGLMSLRAVELYEEDDSNTVLPDLEGGGRTLYAAWFQRVVTQGKKDSVWVGLDVVTQG